MKTKRTTVYVVDDLNILNEHAVKKCRAVWHSETWGTFYRHDGYSSGFDRNQKGVCTTLREAKIYFLELLAQEEERIRKRFEEDMALITALRKNGPKVKLPPPKPGRKR